MRVLDDRIDTPQHTLLENTLACLLDYRVSVLKVPHIERTLDETVTPTAVDRGTDSRTLHLEVHYLYVTPEGTVVVTG